MEEKKKIMVLCYQKCTTCQKALKWLDEHHIAYTARPIKEEKTVKRGIKSMVSEEWASIKTIFQYQRKSV